MDKIDELIKDHQNAADIINHVNKIIRYIDYEVDKFRDTRASVIFTGSLHPSSLYTMASHTKYYDLTQGINNVSIEIEKINNKYELQLNDLVCTIFYERFSNIAIKFLDSKNSPYSQEVKFLLSNRDNIEKNILFETMQNLIMKLDEIDNSEVKEIIEIILKADPLYKPLIDTGMHTINTKELNFDFVDYAIKLFNKIYKQTFGDKDDNDEHNSPKI